MVNNKVNNNNVTFNDAKFAQDFKGQNEKKLSRIRKGLIVAAVAQVAWILTLMLGNVNTSVSDFFCHIAFLGTVAAYIIGGGLGAAFKAAWGCAKKLLVAGWILVPFPVNIFAGLFLSVLGFVWLPTVILCLPLVLVALNFRRVKKDVEAAEEYLNYCAA